MTVVMPTRILVEEARATPLVRQGLWTESVVRTAVVGNAFGGLMILGAWYRLSGLADPRDHGLWLGVAVFGLLVAGLGNALTVVAGRGRITSRVGAVTIEGLGDEGRAVATAGFVTVPGLTRYHRPGCQLVIGKDVVPVGSESLRPCGLCQP